MPKVFIVFIAVPLIYLSLDLADSYRNIAVSDVWRGYKILIEKGIEGKDVVFYRDCGRTREVMGFYFNRLSDCTQDPRDLFNYKAIITPPGHIGELRRFGYKESFIKGHEKRGKDFFILFRKEKEAR